MNHSNIPRLMLAAAASGSGKTTVTCGLLQALLNQGIAATSFKCGPDYIDPMFHQEVIGVPARNLDLFFTDEATTNYLLAKNAQNQELAIIEGVMGFYDGLGGDSTVASSYHLAKVTQTPVVLIVNCKGMSVSIAAQIKGFMAFRWDSGICGVILNNVSAMLYPTLQKMIEDELEIPVFGYLPPLPDCSLESRHLGLVTANEVAGLKAKLQKLANTMAETIDFSALLQAARQAPPLPWQAPQLPALKLATQPTVAVAKDKVFCFYYQDALDLLEELGAKLVCFSPLADEKLPPGIGGLYLGGGYPELYASQLAANATMLQSIKQSVNQGLPCFAECGGFMYLHQELEAMDGKFYSMAGVVPGQSYRTPKLNRFGYVELTAKQDNLLCRQGQTIAAHEFHYWDSSCCGDAFTAQKPRKNRQWECIVAAGNLVAGYPHLHFYANPQFAAHFVARCAAYRAAAIK